MVLDNVCHAKVRRVCVYGICCYFRLLKRLHSSSFDVHNRRDDAFEEHHEWASYNITHTGRSFTGVVLQTHGTRRKMCAQSHPTHLHNQEHRTKGILCWKFIFVVRIPYRAKDACSLCVSAIRFKVQLARMMCKTLMAK